MVAQDEDRYQFPPKVMMQQLIELLPEDVSHLYPGIAGKLGKIHVPDDLAGQAEAIQEMLAGLARLSSQEDAWNRLCQRDGQLVFDFDGTRHEAATGRQLRVLLALWQVKEGGIRPWVSFRYRRSGDGVRFEQYYREPLAAAYAAVALDREWITDHIAALERDEAGQEAAQVAAAAVLGEAAEREMTIGELAAGLSLDGSPRALASELPKLAAQYGLSVRRAVHPATGKPKKDPKTNRALFSVTILRSFDPSENAPASENSAKDVRRISGSGS